LGLEVLLCAMFWLAGIVFNKTPAWAKQFIWWQMRLIFWTIPGWVIKKSFPKPARRRRRRQRN
jgi:hypothetical protein